MPPPRAKLHKNTGKSRPGPPQIVHTNHPNPEAQPNASTSSSPSDSINSLTSEQEQQFQTELYWCIQQLQIALSSNKLNNKQIQDHTKALNTLMSNTAPMIKKRQVMRLSFGDYRDKMAAEERKKNKITMTVTQAKPNQKSIFIKKAIITPSQNNFKFNFPSPEMNQNESIPDSSTNGQLEKTTNNTLVKEINNSVFVRSDNSFKFNFSNEECTGNS